MAKLPSSFKPILWSYDFNKCDPNKMKRTIILQALNYGTLSHWNWVREFYGGEEIKNILANTAITEIHPKTRKLIGAIFNYNNWNYASGGSQ
jgi:hypothetical protein